MSDAASIVTVINPVEGKRYKMSMKGDVSRLTIRKIKKYLANSCGISPEEQCLKYNGVELGEDVMGGEVGITTGSTLTVERKGPSEQPFVASPTKQALEMETLDQQRAMLQHERMRREEEFRRHQEALVGSISQAEARKRDLEREKVEKEQELKRLADLEAAAEQERQRLRAYREEEAEREALRDRDLGARKEQLQRERAMQRQLEMQKLENERKKMLLAQQEAEYEAEKARVDRERREHQERVKRQELAIREKEVEMERAQVEAERARRDLDNEKAMLNQVRSAEASRLTHERSVDSTRLQDAIHGSRTPEVGGGGGGYGGAGRGPSRSVSSSHPSMSSVHVTSTPTPGRSSSILEKERELERLRREKEELEYERQLERQLEEERANLANSQQRAGSGQSRHRSPPQPPVSVPPAATPRGSAAAPPAPANADARSLALEQLGNLAADLGVASLRLDDNNTCVVSVEDKYTLLITFDPQTERIYLYSTLATFIPTNAEVKLKLYEFLMEGALLGRDMCGGGVGASLKNDFILMSTSIHLPTSAVSALQTIAPQFVESLVKWRSRVKDLLANEDFGMASSNTNDGAAGVTPSPAMSRPNRQASTNRHPSPESHVDHGSDYPMVGIEVTDGVTVDGVHSKYDDGVVVVSCKGPASRAGILPNDYIRAVNGRQVTSLKAFQSVIQSLRPHTTVPFSLDRAGSHLVVSVMVGSSSSRPGEARYKNIVRVNESAMSH